MSGTLGLGVPVPKMLPITGTWVLPFTAYFIFLTDRVVYRRLTTNTPLGDCSASPSADSSSHTTDPLYIDARCQANFLEYVPIALILAGVAELNGANRKTLNYALAALLAFRMAHVELGLKMKDANGLGRFVGFYGTQAWLATVAGWGAYCVRGFWGYQ